MADWLLGKIGPHQPSDQNAKSPFDSLESHNRFSDQRHPPNQAMRMALIREILRDIGFLITVAKPAKGAIPKTGKDLKSLVANVRVETLLLASSWRNYPGKFDDCSDWGFCEKTAA